MTDSVSYKWVIAKYAPKSGNGIWALASAQKGVGYILLNPDRANNEPIAVALKWIITGEPLPSHLTEATSSQSDMFEGIDRRRRGVNQK